MVWQRARKNCEPRAFLGTRAGRAAKPVAPQGFFNSSKSRPPRAGNQSHDRRASRAAHKVRARLSISKYEEALWRGTLQAVTSVRWWGLFVDAKVQIRLDARDGRHPIGNRVVRGGSAIRDGRKHARDRVQ